MQSKVPSSLEVAPLALGTDFPSAQSQQALKIVRKRMVLFIFQIGQWAIKDFSKKTWNY